MINTECNSEIFLKLFNDVMHKLQPLYSSFYNGWAGIYAGACVSSTIAFM